MYDLRFTMSWGLGFEGGVDVGGCGGDGDAGGGAFEEDEGGVAVDGGFAGGADAFEDADGGGVVFFLVLPGAQVVWEGAEGEGKGERDHGIYDLRFTIYDLEEWLAAGWRGCEGGEV